MIDHTTITAFVFACVAILALVTGFLLKGWATTVMKTMTTLTKDVQTLTGMVGQLKMEHELLDLKHQYQAKEIAALAARSCDQIDCPYKTVHIRRDDITHPGTNGGTVG